MIVSRSALALTSERLARTSAGLSLIARSSVLPQARSYYSPSKLSQYTDGVTKTSSASKPADASATSNTQSEESTNKPAPPKMLKRDEEMLALLLDREGGAAGVSTIEGNYEEGLGPVSKKNMFRYI